MLRHFVRTLYSSRIIVFGPRRHVAGVIGRSFRTSSLVQRNCDIGSPCLCSELKDAARKPVCEVCNVRPTEHQTSEYTDDREGAPHYKFKSFCGECFRIATSGCESDEARRIRIARWEKTRDMLERVGQLKFSEQLPIRYAVEKLSNEVESVGRETHSPRWYKTFIFEVLTA